MSYFDDMDMMLNMVLNAGLDDKKQYHVLQAKTIEEALNLLDSNNITHVLMGTMDNLPQTNHELLLKKKADIKIAYVFCYGNIIRNMLKNQVKIFKSSGTNFSSLFLSLDNFANF